VHSIAGCERAHILRPGYSIEYDYFDPRALKSTLETKAIHGSSSRPDQRHDGYEEAAAQGFSPASMPRVRARRRRMVAAPRRSVSRRAVDDLITRGVTEPYRMFTSRARIPVAAARRQRRPATDRARRASSASSTTRAGTCFARKRDAIALEQTVEVHVVNPASCRAAMRSACWDNR
jgi:tRNA uridine 5-carboxymethylaminomethyl modification enzyme